MITVCHDCHVVLFLTRRTEAKIRISYLRDDDLSWAEELCALAEAHAQILQAECYYYNNNNHKKGGKHDEII